METAGKLIEELVKELPPDILTEVRDFIEVLLAKREQRTSKTLHQDWTGALSEYRHQTGGVSKDFDRTDRSRLTPGTILAH